VGSVSASELLSFVKFHLNGCLKVIISCSCLLFDLVSCYKWTLFAERFGSDSGAWSVMWWWPWPTHGLESHRRSEFVAFCFNLFCDCRQFREEKKSNIDPLQNVMLLRTCSVADVETEIDNSEE